MWIVVRCIAREDFRLRALESEHTCTMCSQRIFYNKTYAAFCLTHFKFDYNLLTYICFGFCTSVAARNVTFNSFYWNMPNFELVDTRNFDLHIRKYRMQWLFDWFLKILSFWRYHCIIIILYSLLWWRGVPKFTM